MQMQMPIHAPYAPYDGHRPPNRVAALPHHHVQAGPANGYYYDGPHADEYCRAPTYRQQDTFPAYPPQEDDWSPTPNRLFLPAARPYEQLPAELEPVSLYPDVRRIPQYYPHSGDNEDDGFDIAALADQFLDLEEHCPMPQRSLSPYSDTTQASDGPSSSRRRTADHLPRLPPVRMSDDEDEDDRTNRTGLSPFYYSPSPPSDSDPEPPRPRAHQHQHQHHSHAHTHAPPRAPLKFTEARKDGRSKRQPLACFFCRKRKIACGGPPKGAADPTCDQCARRGVECEYPTESRRGQHSRIKSLARRAQEAGQYGLGQLQMQSHVGVLLPLLHPRH